MLFDAGWNNKLAAVQWLRQQGADWPSGFTGTALLLNGRKQVCWTVPVVRWALNNGSTWGNWQCAHLRADLYDIAYRKQRARQLFTWAHKNGCPCTCVVADPPAAVMA
jgi:hypothetical protein